MNPLEAMAKAIYESIHPGEKWEDAVETDRAIAFTNARAARDALADNVDADMVRAYSESWWGDNTIVANIADAIRAAGEG